MVWQKLPSWLTTEGNISMFDIPHCRDDYVSRHQSEIEKRRRHADAETAHIDYLIWIAVAGIIIFGILPWMII